MGGGSYSYSSASTRSVNYSKSSKEKVFTQRMLSSDMNINGKVRESCDSPEHPNSYPIIIALDVTGSMGRIPYELVSGAFPKIMKSIMDAGVQDAQVCFVGIGDDSCDDAPIQCGQFETSDELTEKWLKHLYLEGGGGCNLMESYALAWYFAAFHTSIDSFKKRNKKGCLITVGDEPLQQKYSKHSIKELFGDTLEDSVKVTNLYSIVSEQWEIFHIDAGGMPWNFDKVLPKDRLLKANRSINSISAKIIQAILTAYNSNVTESLTISDVSSIEEVETEHLL